jgi:hypothetical protein
MRFRATSCKVEQFITEIAQRKFVHLRVRVEA